MTSPPCPDLDRLVDAALAGRHGAAAALEAHAAACPACAAETVWADSDDALGAETVACLRAPVCPPDVLDAALARVRTHAPDRAAALVRDPSAARTARPWSRAGIWKLGAPVLAAVAALVWALSGPASDPVTGPLVAVETPAPVPSPTETASPPAPDPSNDPSPVGLARPALVRPTPARPASGRLEASPVPSVAAAPVLPPVADAALSAADSVAAHDGLALALAIVGRAQQTAETAVSTELDRVMTALEPTRIL